MDEGCSEYISIISSMRDMSLLYNSKQLLKRIIQIENLYMKFILTVIALTLIIISIELADRNRYCVVDFLHGTVDIDGTVEVSGKIDTYEQNTVIGQGFNP